MRSYHEIRERLAQDIVIEVPLAYNGDEDRMTVGREIAEWILMKYEPPVVYEEIPPDNEGRPFPDQGFRWTYELRVFMGGEWHGMKQLVHPEVVHHNPLVAASTKRHMQRRLGASIMEKLWPL
jgi:hypothetical protein